MHFKAPRQCRERGFTMVELLIALGVVAVLATVGIPSLRNFTLQQRVRDTAQQLQLDVAYARSEAITRADTISLCTSDTGTGCTGTGWQSGWIIFVDSNGDGAINGADTVIRRGNNPLPGLTISAAPVANTVTINSRGRAGTNLVLSVCKTGLKGRDLTIRTSGNPSISVPSGLCP